MATQITAFSEQTRRTGKPRKYPWEIWTQGGVWEIVRGKDFDIAPSSMAGLIRKHAQRAGLKVTCHVYVDRIEFEFFEVGAEPTGLKAAA